MQLLTLSGYEVTDIERSSNRTKGVSDSGFMADAFLKDGSIGIRRAATNLHPYGQCDAILDAAWNRGSNGTVTFSIDATTPAPFAPQSVKYVTDGTFVNQSVAAQSNSGLAVAAGTWCSGSIYFKGTAGVSYVVRLRLLNTDATTTFPAITNFVATGDWQLLRAASAQVAAGKTLDRLMVEVYNPAAVPDTFWAAHPMLETGQSVVAPYVATSGGVTATHPAGRVQADASLVTADVGWMAVRARMGRAATSGDAAFLGVSDGGPTNRYSVIWNTASGKWELANASGGSSTFPSVTAGAAFAANDLKTVIFMWDGTKLYLSVDGSAFVPTTKTYTPTSLTTIDIGSLTGSSRWMDGDIFWFACGTGTLTDADAARIATCTSGSPRAYIGAAAQMTACFPQPGIGELVPPVILVP